METMDGLNNWNLLCRREGRGVTILRAETCDTAAALPERVWDLPVTALAARALAPDREPAAGGTAVRVLCGPPPTDPAWDNRALRDLTLPPSLRRVEDYALLNCGALNTLRLHDGVEHWGGGVTMNCRSLRTLFLRREDGVEREALAYFADELSRELDVTVTGPGGTARLIFPEYREAYEENCPAHHFDYCIYGGGYPYHHCFHQKKLIVREYDRLWRQFLGTDHEDACALALAWWRLRCPVELTPEAESGYLDYLRGHTAQALLWRVGQRDTPGLAYLLDRAEPDGAALSAAAQAAREGGAAEALALLLERRRGAAPTGRDKTFAL